MLWGFILGSYPRCRQENASLRMQRKRHIIHQVSHGSYQSPPAPTSHYAGGKDKWVGVWVRLRGPPTPHPTFLGMGFPSHRTAVESAFINRRALYQRIQPVGTAPLSGHEGREQPSWQGYRP